MLEEKGNENAASYPPNKMTARRISDIVIALMRAKKRGARLNGKSALERELAAWIAVESPCEVVLNPCPAPTDLC